MSVAPQVLVVANRTCPCPGLVDLVAQRTGPDGRVHVVAPALNGRLRHAFSDSDGALAAARERLELVVGLLRERGVVVDGEVGDADPLAAAHDALATFAATEIVVSTLPEGHSHWLERGLLMRLRTQVALPVTHVVSRYGVREELVGPAAAA